MEKWLTDILPIMDVEHDAIVSKQGDISIVFKCSLPEIFTLSDENYEAIHQGLVKAIKVLPKDSILHKQDWFNRTLYHSPEIRNNGFLKATSAKHFEGRPYLSHESFIVITKKAGNRKAASSIVSNLFRSSIVAEQTINPLAIEEFEDVCGQFQRILESVGIGMRRMKDNELLSASSKAGIIERYCNLSSTNEPVFINDVQFKDDFKIGDKHVQLYTLADTEDMPALCASKVTYEKFSTDRTKFSIGFASSLGLLLPCDHIYNQYIIIGDAQSSIKKLESKRLRLQSLSNYSRENAIARDAVNEFLNECISQARLPVRAHFNLLVWADHKEELKEIKNMVATSLAQMNAVAKQETVGAAQIYWAGIPGNAADLPLNDTFETFAEQASCFLTLETNYKSCLPENGIRFCDRLSGKPVYVDLFDAPRKEGVTSNMGMLVCGTSGGGKSMTVNHILRTLYDQQAHCVVVDIGGSYKGLCELVQGYYFTYEESNPIRFNPFYLAEGDILDTEKKESLKALLIALWKQENERFNRSEYVALSNALSGYYEYLQQRPKIFPCFNTFYEYLQEDYVHVLKAHNVKESDFDVSNFLYVLRPYYHGEFDYLLNAKENLDLLHQPFVVFELDAIKDHPILFPVVTLIIMEMFISKMRKLSGKRKVLVIDEAWKAIAKSGMAEFLKYAFKTIRKFNGIPCVITQELDDLVNSPIIKDAIINNADIKILMDMRKFINKFDKLQDTLGLSEKSKTILLSVNKDNREIFIDLGGHVSKVYKNELCPEEYFAFTTDGRERVKVLQYAATYGSMEKGITRLVDDIKNGK
ncbi:TraG family conjugative transposon ATPase [Pinibacter aurantiacus]|uniref:TraG family conjugative transposon ATPase n=1 Tax=Pinibacter aurantiacus TaxID=2851599 RepID=A0A9E2W3Y4_9BACT|nr:TraG family conjugative transposon ATPase [Pinibacter aurantiacus]MBV4357319.1 TraG family conjugative transposon ATPase [Pinibacter aurantiacus]